MKELQEFKEKKHEDILRSMIDYMNFDEDEDEDDDDFDCGYTQDDIDTCGIILDNYINELEKSINNETLIMQNVKNVVLQLNELNKKCDYSLIETDQREYLCPFIEEAAFIAGYPKTTDDITFEWREW